MKGQIVIMPTGQNGRGRQTEIRAVCRADSLATCNRTLLWFVNRDNVQNQTDRAKAHLFDAGCQSIIIHDLTAPDRAQIEISKTEYEVTT